MVERDFIQKLQPDLINMMATKPGSPSTTEEVGENIGKGYNREGEIRSKPNLGSRRYV